MKTLPMKKIEDENDVRNHIVHEAEADHWHVSHIESGTTSPGIPDLALSKNDVTLWLEIKVMKNGEVSMRPPQRRWHRKQAAAGGRSFVLAYINNRLHPIKGSTAAQLIPKSVTWWAGDGWEIGRVKDLLRNLALGRAPLIDQ